MALEFVDDMARGSRWWDEVGHYDVDDDADSDDQSKETVSRRDRRESTSEALESSERSDTTAVDAPKPEAMPSEQGHSTTTTELPFAFLLEDALTN
jgi:hypothetical protein